MRVGLLKRRRKAETRWLGFGLSVYESVIVKNKLTMELLRLFALILCNGTLNCFDDFDDRNNRERKSDGN